MLFSGRVDYLMTRRKKKQTNKQTTLGSGWVGFKKWFNSDCASLRKELNSLCNKMHRNPLDSNLKKNFKKLNQTDDLARSKDNQKFRTFPSNN